MKNKLLYAAIFVSVVVIFHVSYGLRVLMPTNVSWLLTVMHDWGTHYLGWYFYRNEGWQFPLGQVSNYFYPIGTNVGYTDSIPLLALLFKPFAGLLPEDFQYFGLWLFACHLLTAYFTVQLCRLLGLGSLYTFVAVLFIVANPVLIFRGFHPALCAHWLLLASVYVYLSEPLPARVPRLLGYQVVLLLISALVNPYLCLMVLGCSFMLALKFAFFDKVLAKGRFFGYLGASVAALLAVWYVLGLITLGKKEDFAVEGAFGLYSMNLNALFNPQGFSALLPPLPQVSWHQYEGFMYLGVGVFLLLVAATVCLFYFRPVAGPQEKPRGLQAYFNNVPLAPVLLTVVLYTLFALTNVISIHDQVLLKIPLPGVIIQLGNVFRASARFFWLPYYLILLFALVVVAKSPIRQSVRVALFALALVVQLYDIWPMIKHRKLTYGAYVPPIDNPNWLALMQQFDEVVFYPPFGATYHTNLDYQYFSFLAARTRKPINIGYVARADNNAVTRYTEQLNNELVGDQLPPRKLYITTQEHLKNFSYALQLGTARLNILNNYYYLVSSKTNNPQVLAVSNAVNRGKEAQLDSVVAALDQKKAVFVEVNKINAPSRDSVQYNLDNFSDQPRYLNASGWAFVRNTDNNQGDSIFLYLDGRERSYLLSTDRVARPDVTEAHKKKYLDDAGFNAFALKQGVAAGHYTLGIAIKRKGGRWVHQFTGKTIAVTGNGSPYATLKAWPQAIPAGNIQWGIDRWETEGEVVHAAGWAFFKNQSTEDAEIQLVLVDGSRVFTCQTEPFARPDVTASFGNSHNLDQAGFNAAVARNIIPKGTYRLGIYIWNRETRAEGMALTDKTISIP